MKKNSLKVFFLLCLTNLTSHFLYFKRFGLYDDDYFEIHLNRMLNIGELLNFIVYRVQIANVTSGRPLSFIPNMFTYLGNKLGGELYFLYIFAFIIVTLNSFLVYKILKKSFPKSEILAVIAAIAFCLFPSDNTKILLLHAFILQTSFFYFLCATLLYLNNKKILSYFVIIFSLLSYESVFMLFFGIPFLKGKWDKEFRNEMIRHFSVLSLMIGIIFIYRKLIGENRIAAVSSDLLSVAGKIIAAIIIGPLMNLFHFVRAPIATFDYWIRDGKFDYYYDYIFYFIILSLILFFWYIIKIKSDYIPPDTEGKINSEKALSDTSDNKEVSIFFRNILKIFIAGVILICLGYVVSFTHFPPTEIMGRTTSVHLAATFGASIIFGCICASVLFISEKYNFKRLAVSVLSVYLALLVAYNTITQKEFVQSWMFQKTFWKQIVNVCPDLNENTVILLSGSYKLFFYTKYILSLSPQSNSIILRQLYKFPKGWSYPPKVIFIFSNWQDKLSYKGDKLILQMAPLIEPAIIQDSNVIFVRANNNLKLSRIDTTFNLNGNIIRTKPQDESTLKLYEKTKLYDLMIKPD